MHQFHSQDNIHLHIAGFLSFLLLYMDLLLVGPISQTSIHYMDFVEISNILLDLSTVYFAHFIRCRASFAYCCYSILECLLVNYFPAVGTDRHGRQQL